MWFEKLKFLSSLSLEVGERVGDFGPPLDQLRELLPRVHQVAAAAAASPAGATAAAPAARRLGRHAGFAAVSGLANCGMLWQMRLS